jgi:hypothetical protein
MSQLDPRFENQSGPEEPLTLKITASTGVTARIGAPHHRFDQPRGPGNLLQPTLLGSERVRPAAPQLFQQRAQPIAL